MPDLPRKLQETPHAFCTGGINVIAAVPHYFLQVAFNEIASRKSTAILNLRGILRIFLAPPLVRFTQTRAESENHNTPRRHASHVMTKLSIKSDKIKNGLIILRRSSWVGADEPASLRSTTGILSLSVHSSKWHLFLAFTDSALCITDSPRAKR